MKVVALVSGGKDSCYNMQLCESYGHELYFKRSAPDNLLLSGSVLQIVALANLLPLHDAVDELDSFMYQTVGHQVVAAFAQCMRLPLFRRRIQGSPRISTKLSEVLNERLEAFLVKLKCRAKDLRYSATEGDEVEDLEVLLRVVKSRVPGLGGVSTGAIASDYQRLRVENVCSRLDLVSLAYMWKQDQASLLQNMIDSGLQAVLVKVAAMGLDPHEHLGKDLTTLQPLFLKLQDLYGCNVCGEGGEYESLTLDCLLFKNAKIVLDEFTLRLHSPDTIAPVGVLHATEFHLEYKSLELDRGSTELLFEVTNDFVTNNHVSETHATISQSSSNFTGSRSCLEGSIQPELLTHVNRQRHGFVAISCWRKSGQPHDEMQCQLGILLGEIEKNLQTEKLCWADVLGVPSRCCVELPLDQAGMGQVIVEILATTDPSKKVLHVQSISSWAPCCIGPYSQATQHRQLMYMAGQLGLYPPTMNLVPGGAACEMTQALKNCEAVAEVFTQPFLNSVLSFTVYCSSPTRVKGMQEVEGVLDKYLSRKIFVKTSRIGCILPKPVVLYILLPALPKGALVEVAPLTCTAGSSYENYSGSYEEADATSWELISKHAHTVVSPGVEEFSLCKGLFLPGNLCRAFTFLSYRISTAEVGLSWSSLNWHVALRPTFELMSSLLAEAALSWADVFVLRVYFVVEKISADSLREALGTEAEDFLLKNVPEPTLIPVGGVGNTGELQDLIAVELTASGRR